MMLCVYVSACAQTYRLGDEADEIETIQTALKQLKVYSGEITGHFGEKTEVAVKLFQKKYALEDDGICGEDTIKALYEAAGISYSGSSSSTTSSSNSASSSSSALLRHGTKSDAVRKMQEDLTKLGYYKGSITGNFGNLTEAAVMSFQRANGLTADGVAGAKTLAKIASKRSSGSSSSASSSSSKNIGRTKARDIALKHAGLSASQVRDLEVELDKEGGKSHYDVDFEKGGYDYDYEIDAESGKILKSRKERD